MDAYKVTKYFVERLVNDAGRTVDQIIIDTGLAPVGADTYGLVNIGLDAMKMINNDPDLKGVHMVVGLSNFAWGTPKFIRHKLERAYLTLAMRNGLDFALANPEKHPFPLEEEHPLVAELAAALKQGRPLEGESQEMAGFRQASAILDLCRNAEPDEEDDL
jgi:5-methyltetrahydrofolate--homocysteine methyltransferase